MVVDHALGIAGGAGGVVERDRAAFVGRRRPDEIGIALGDERLVFDAAQALARPGMKLVVDVDHQRSLLQPRQCRPDLAGEFAIGDQHPGLAVLQDIGDGGGLEPGIDGVEHGAEHGHAVVRLHHRRHVRQHDRDGVAGAHAGSGERRRQLSRPPVELAIAETAGAVDHRRAVGMDVGAARQEGYRSESREIRRRQPAGPRRCCAACRAGARRRATTGGATWRSCACEAACASVSAGVAWPFLPSSGGVIGRGEVPPLREAAMLATRACGRQHSRARLDSGTRGIVALSVSGRPGGVRLPTFASRSGPAHAAVRRRAAVGETGAPAANSSSQPALRGGAIGRTC